MSAALLSALMQGFGTPIFALTTALMVLAGLAVIVALFTDDQDRRSAALRILEILTRSRPRDH